MLSLGNPHNSNNQWDLNLATFELAKQQNLKSNESFSSCRVSSSQSVCLHSIKFYGFDLLFCVLTNWGPKMIFENLRVRLDKTKGDLRTHSEPGMKQSYTNHEKRRLVSDYQQEMSTKSQQRCYDLQDIQPKKCQLDCEICNCCSFTLTGLSLIQTAH